MGHVHSIEPMGVFDGPGIRGVVFFFGCQLRCRYCHNPDTWTIASDHREDLDVEEIFRKLDRYLPYYRASGGGITASGGEPLLQAEFCTQLFMAAHQRGLNTCLDTAGYDDNAAGALIQTEGLLAQTDLILLDIKSADPERFKWITGCSIDYTLEFARAASMLDIPIVVRHVLVPGVTDGEGELTLLKELALSIPTAQRVEILPYHNHARFKWVELGLTYPLEGIEPPSKEALDRAIEITKITRYPKK